MRPGGSSFHGANLTPEVTQYVGHVMGNSSVEGHSDGHHLMVEAASPISSRPPALQVSFDESAPAVTIAGVPDEDDSLVREEGERGAASANRWPRPETLTLLKIRSDMDAVFREATIKGPLWEDVSRKMSEMGYNRSAKKCKEKFENVHKYYKRTKEGKARRQDGKSYRFFTELEALHGTVTTTSVTTTIQGLNYAPPTAAILPPPPPTVTHINSNQPTSCNNAFVAPTTGNSTMLQSQRSNATPIFSDQPIRPPVASTKRASADVSVQETSLSLGGSSDSGESSSSEETQGDNHPKRIKPSTSPGLNTNEMMNFFRDLMKRVVEEQVTMQQRLFEDAEKREADRMVREEVWRRHEMGRLSRELDVLAQERALWASRDATIFSLLQKFTGATTAFPLPSPPPPPTVQLLPTPSPKTADAVPIVPMAEEAMLPQKQPNNHQQEQPPEQPKHPQTMEAIRPIRNQACTNVAVAAPEKSLTDFDPASSRWPKVEVLALIKLRSGLESRYQETWPKGRLWEEISAEMSKMGYRRTSKRCKEKWENINKYFRKMKESNKKRQEDAKTCPYFHELEALHKKKMLGGTPMEPEPDPPEFIPPPERLGCDRMKIMPIPVSVVVVPANSMAEAGGMELVVGNNGGSDQMQIRSNTGFESSNGEEGNVVAADKPVDIVRDLMEKRPQHQAVMDDYAKMEDPDDDSDANTVEDDFEDEHDCYEARYRNQNGPAMARGSDSFVTMIR